MLDVNTCDTYLSGHEDEFICVPFAERAVKVMILLIKAGNMIELLVFLFAVYLLAVLFVRHLLSGYNRSGYLTEKHNFSFLFPISPFVFYLTKQNRRDVHVFRIGLSSHGHAETQIGGSVCG